MPRAQARITGDVQFFVQPVAPGVNEYLTRTNGLEREMVKTYHLHNISPEEALEQIHRSGIINYMFNWGYSIDEQRKSLTITLSYGGGTDPEKEKEMLKQIDAFIKSIDVVSE